MRVDHCRRQYVAPWLQYAVHVVFVDPVSSLQYGLRTQYGASAVG